MKRILHVITGLTTGGAELMLARLVCSLQRRFDHHIVALGDEGPPAELIRATGIPVRSLGIGRGTAGLLPTLRRAGTAAPALWQLRQEIRRLRPHLVQGWMYHGNVAASLTTATADSSAPVGWSIHSMAGASRRRSTAVLVRAGALLSHQAAWVHYVSAESAAEHAALGYRQDRAQVIPLGFDTQRLQPDDSARRRARQALGIAPKELVIGHLARWHPVKDHATFLAAAAEATRRGAERGARLRVVLAGPGVTATCGELVARLKGHDWPDPPLLLGELDSGRVPELLRAFDVFVLSSTAGESSPTVLGEAMACGVPVVTTRTGDAATLVGDAGVVVPPSDPSAMATALVALCCDRDRLERQVIGAQLRERIITHYSEKATAQAFAEAWQRF